MSAQIDLLLKLIAGILIAVSSLSTPVVAELVGIGLEVTMEEGTLKVVAPIDGSPAARAGILTNDMITHVNDEPLLRLTLNQAIERLRGPTGTTLTLRILRKDRDKPIEMELTRDTIPLRSIRPRMEGDDVGYIRIAQFNPHATQDLRKAIDEISTQALGDKLKGYVIDLRNNPGGLLEEAVSVADALLDQGEIVSTRGRNQQIQRFHAKAGDLAKGKPIIVLINGGSAAAAEVVAAALADNKRARLVGSRSFGMGSLQTLIPLAEGQGMIRLTTARYFTPGGRVIHGNGIAPDIEVLQEVPDEKTSRATKGGKRHSDLQSYIPSDTNKDKALQRALDLLRTGKARG